MANDLKQWLRSVLPAGCWSCLKSLRLAALRTLYAGNHCVCPICQSRLRKLLPAGYSFPVLTEKQVVGGMRGPVACPVCRALDRTRLLYLYLEHQTDLFQRPQKVLHFAPERAVEERGRAVSGDQYLTADLYVQHVMHKVDLTNIQFPDNTFDAVICCHVLEHVPDDCKAMQEIFRVLKPGGWAVLQVPISVVLKETYEDFSITSEAGREQAFGQCDHVRIYGLDYKNRLEQAGFKVTVFRWTEAPEKFGTLANQFGLNEQEAIYRVDKTPINH